MLQHGWTLKKLFLSEKNTSHKGLHSVWIHSYEMSRVGRFIKDRNPRAGGGGGGRNGEIWLMGTGFLWGAMKMF